MSGLDFLYGTAAGRALLRPLTARPLSRLAGRALETRASKALIGPFVRKNRMDLTDYDLRDLNSFNDFFPSTRTPRPSPRPATGCSPPCGWMGTRCCP